MRAVINNLRTHFQLHVQPEHGQSCWLPWKPWVCRHCLLVACYVDSLDILLPKESLRALCCHSCSSQPGNELGNLPFMRLLWSGIPPKTKQYLTWCLPIPLSHRKPPKFKKVKPEPLVFNFQVLRAFKTGLHFGNGKSHEGTALHTDLLSLITSPQRMWAGQQVQLSLSAPISCSL